MAEVNQCGNEYRKQSFLKKVEGWPTRRTRRSLSCCHRFFWSLFYFIFSFLTKKIAAVETKEQDTGLKAALEEKLSGRRDSPARECDRIMNNEVRNNKNGLPGYAWMIGSGWTTRSIATTMDGFDPLISARTHTIPVRRKCKSHFRSLDCKTDGCSDGQNRMSPTTYL